MHDQGSQNLRWTDALIDGLAAAGVRRAVVSPGSRSTPLVLACTRRLDFQVWTKIDERSAAFFALGLARHDQSPVALIATSGTAPANWYPAIIEANHSGIPLILLSADRPPEQQGCGANQTIDQKQLFGRQVRAFHDPGPAQSGAAATDYIRALGMRAVHQAHWPNPGPVHINLPFREPLIPESMFQPAASSPYTPVSIPKAPLEQDQMERITNIISGRHGLIICGPAAADDGFANAVAELARRIQVPLLADPLSNLRFGHHGHSNIICRYDAFLRRHSFTERNQPQWVMHFGARSVSKTLLQYLEQSTATTIISAPRGDWPDPLHRTVEMVRTDPVEMCNTLADIKPQPAPAEWLSDFLREESRARDLHQHAADDLPCEDRLVEELIAALPAGTTLFCGNSMPIRQLDSWSGTGANQIRILTNRGVSGIDGNVSTLVGLATAAGKPVVGLLGDLALYHDMNGLLAAADTDGVIVLLNNSGGGIFGYLPQRELKGFKEHWLTPTHLDFSLVAKLYGLDFHQVTRQTEFTPALKQALSEPGLSLIEVVIDRTHSIARHQAYWKAVAKG